MQRALIVAAICVAGIGVSCQGWRGRVPDDEAASSIVQAVALVRRGVIPDRGTLTELGAYFPPGTAWLVAPGVLVVDDLRQVELIGGLGLYVGAIIAIFLLMRRWFGTTAAILAAVIYAFSDVALRFSDGLWPRGHPFFYVWMLVFIERWVRHRRAGWLAATLIVWAAGMYVHLEMAPAIAMVPAIWWIYRPPVTWQAMLAAAAVVLVMWQPYLEFQRGRDFIDLRAQLLLQPLSVEGGNGAFSWCEPEPALPARFREAAAARSIAARAIDSAMVSTSTMRSRVPGGSVLLLALVVAGLISIGWPTPSTHERDPARLLVVALVVPWAILLVFGQERLLGVWSLQAMVVGAFASGAGRRAWLRRSELCWAAALIAVIASATNPIVLQRVRDYREHGWAGLDPPGVAEIRYAHQCEATNRPR